MIGICCAAIYKNCPMYVCVLVLHTCTHLSHLYNLKYTSYMYLPVPDVHNHNGPDVYVYVPMTMSYMSTYQWPCHMHICIHLSWLPFVCFGDSAIYMYASPNSYHIHEYAYMTWCVFCFIITVFRYFGIHTNVHAPWCTYMYLCLGVRTCTCWVRTCTCRVHTCTCRVCTSTCRVRTCT